MTYYEQSDKITYDKGAEVVAKFVKEYSDTVTYVTAREVCLKMDIEPSQHNQHRVYRALEERFEISGEWESKPRKFEVE